MKKKQSPRQYYFLKLVFCLVIGSGILLCAFGSSISQKINNWLVYSHLIGQELAVVRYGKMFILEFGLIRANYIVRPLAENLEGSARFPEWSPDGEWIAFDYYEGERWGSWREDERSVYLIKADGTHLQRITSGVSPQWDSSGKIIYFTDWNDYETVKAIEIDTGIIRDVIHSRDCEVSGVVGNYRVSQLNNRVLVQISNNTYEWNPETRVCRRVSYGWDADWSFGGGIALGSFRPGYNEFQSQPQLIEDAIHNVYVVDGGSPSWSPDGRYFVYDSPHDRSLFSWSIYVYDTVTEDVYDLSMDFAHPSWRPE